MPHAVRLGLLIALLATAGWNPVPADEAAAPPANLAFHADEIPAVPQTEAGEGETGRRTGEDWPEFLGTRGTGVSGETGLLERWPAAGPPVLWKKQTGEGYAAPSIRGNRLVLIHRPQTRQGTSGPKEVVECVAADTGDPQWQFSYETAFSDPYGYNGGPRATPLLTEDRCYTFGAEGMLTCLALDSGRKIWQRDTGAEFRIPQAFFGVGSTPILEGNLLIVMVGGHPESGVVALDAATGKTVWESVGPKTFPRPPYRIQADRPPEKLASYATPVAATIHGRRHILCLMRTGLVSLDPQTGKVNFSHWFRSVLHDSVNAARPVVVGDQVFLSAAYETGAALLKVHEDGLGVDVVWKDRDAMQNHWTTSIHHHGYVYGFSGRHQPGSSFRCIELETGKLQWQTHDDGSEEEADPKDGRGQTAPKYYGRGSAVLAEGKFIVQAETGLLALVELNPAAFHEISRIQFPELGYPCWTAPVLSRGRLYVCGAKEVRPIGRRHAYEYHLLCLDLARKP